MKKVLVLLAVPLFLVSAFSQTKIVETNIVVETIAGSGFAGNVDGVGLETMFESPGMLSLDRRGNVF